MQAEPVSESPDPRPAVAPVPAGIEETAPEAPARGARIGIWQRWWPVAAAALAWIGFGWAWIGIFLDRASSVGLGGPSLLGSYVVVMLTATLVWRAHNRRLHAQLGARRRVPRVRESWRVDHCGRVLRADWPRVRTSRVVDVTVEDGVKSFHAGAAE